MKNENGVTLIALVLMVILMLILTSVGIYTGVDSYKTMKTKKFEAEMTIVQEKVNIIRDEYKSWEYYPAKSCNEYVMEKYSYDEMYEGTMSKNKPAYVGANYGVSTDPTSPYAILASILDSTKNRVKLDPEDREIGLYNYYYFTAAELEKRFGLTNLDVNVFINFNKGIIIERDGVDAIDVLAIEKRYYILSELQNAQKGGYFVDEAYIDPTDQSIVYTSTAELTSNTTEETKITLTLNRFVSISKIEYAVLADDSIDNSNIPTSSWFQVPSFTYNSTQGIDFQISPNIVGVVRLKVTPKNRDAFINSNSIYITKANNPRIVEGMNRVAWDRNNRIFELTPADPSIVWYDYSSNAKRWANVIFPDGSMYVWIPRFAYKITTENKIEVLFLKDNSNITFDGEQLPEGYIVHPAFRNGQGEESTFMNGEFSSEIPGFWVAKFETFIDKVDNTDSYYYTELNMNEFDYIFRAFPNVDLTNNDDTISLYAALKRVRLLETRMRTIGFTNYQNKAQNIGNDTLDLDNDSNINNIDSHLIKNSEWGAIAYLTYSDYGIGLVEGAMPFSTSKYTGGGKNNDDGRPDYTCEEGMKYSTTGNSTGIYDLTTGRLEMVACISENSSEESFAEENKFKSNQYLTIYPTNENNSIHGDAMNEVSQLITAYSYGGVRQYFTSNKPYILRGGNSGSKFGLFDYKAVGDASDCAIRPIWVLNK